MSRSLIRRILFALVLVTVLVPALPAQAEAAGSVSAIASGVVDSWTSFWNWVLGMNPELPTQAEGHRNIQPDNDEDKGSGIDPNGGGNGNGNGNGYGNGNGNGNGGGS